MTKVVASKSVDRLKWFIALSVFAAAVVGNSYFVEIAFFIQSSWCCISIHYWSSGFIYYQFWIKCYKAYS